MIIVTADSAAEAADLHDLLGHHLAWRHRIYVGGGIREMPVGCAARQPHWGWPCTQAEHPAESAHLSVSSQGEVLALWWDTGTGGAEYRPEDACYHPDPEINAEITADALDAELADLAAGYPPRRWRCPCGAEHSRGHFLAAGVHRCLACGYTGTGGVMLDGEGG